MHKQMGTAFMGCAQQTFTGRNRQGDQLCISRQHLMPICVFRYVVELDVPGPKHRDRAELRWMVPELAKGAA